ncbi:hypothetical protein PFISCL1PPCAC_9497 [Pristionchus fissidentatus]|uniref:Uncharacterized protein n=1 Tax=Pristionchus fissidentatus TaxID=1538716 RepID=A0AAV5VEU4_9BILA|nr:hypothetical protein PFISCL1PPCAC_9497 [Pristionchus fissidentatus]
MTPPHRSAALRATMDPTLPSFRDASELLENDLKTPRRSPRLHSSSTGISKPYKSPFARQPSVNSLGSRLALTHLPGQKRRSTTAITPLRNETSGERSGPTATSPLRSARNTAATTPRSSKSFINPAPLPPLDDCDSGDYRFSSSQGSIDDFDFCGLTPEAQHIYKQKRGITQLYDWQKACLSDDRVRRGDNMIVCLPTGAGKTLVAEVLMLREAIIHKRNSLLVLPYVAIVQEKMTSLSVFEKAFGIHVEEYAASKGRLPPIKRRADTRSIYVATIEKANMLINSLIETDRLDDLGLVVVDELHMIGDGSRGARIESLLTKFMHKGRGQAVGISATLTNMDELAAFMRAFVYSTEFRPVELVEIIKIGQRLLQVDKKTKELKHYADLPPNALASRDPDGICQLLQQVIPRHSAIIFCPTKKNAENVAVMIAKAVPKQMRDVRKSERQALIEMIREEGDGKCEETLERCIEAGVAWHHSGLTHDERKHVEAAYVSGILCVLCATSTLAAGVNLPARRVIIKAPVVGRDRLRKAQYLQMIGRAGRAGFDEKGEAVTILRPGPEERMFREMLAHEEMRCESALAEPDELSSLILDLLSLKVATTVAGLETVLARTLLVQQKGAEEVKSRMSAVLDCLAAQQLVQHMQQPLRQLPQQKVLVVTEVGAAAFGASVAPADSCLLLKDLMASLSTGVNFSSHLHLLYIVAPYDLSCNVDWDLYYKEFTSLPDSEKILLEASGISMQRIISQITKRAPLEAGDSALRLYIALLMQHVWRQEPAAAVAAAFSVERGWLQAALQSTVAHAAAIARFAERLPSTLWPLKLLLPELVSRLSDCTRPELNTLLRLDLVKRSRAAQLHAAGYKTITDVAHANVEVMREKVENLGRYQAMKIVQSAQALLRDQIDEKLEEMEEMGLNAEQIEAMRRTMV